jgi:hypothetical protein
MTARAVDCRRSVRRIEIEARDAARSVALGLLVLLPALAGPVVLAVGLVVEVSCCPLGVHDPGDVVLSRLLALAAFVSATGILQGISALAQSNPHRSSPPSIRQRAATIEEPWHNAASGRKTMKGWWQNCYRIFTGAGEERCEPIFGGAPRAHNRLA